PPAEVGKTGFLSCLRRPPGTPALTTSATPAGYGVFFFSPEGTFSLEWSTLPDAAYDLEEATRPDYSDAVSLYSGSDSRFDVYGHRPGDYYYRVRAEVEGIPGDWSNAVVIPVAPSGGWPVAAGYDDTTLLIVQRGLLRLCAARGDLLAVLGLPAHYREDEAVTHAGRLASAAGPVLRLSLSGASVPAAPGDVVSCSPLRLGEAAVASYGALYHP